jgi:hypothetical protein
MLRAALLGLPGLLLSRSQRRLTQRHQGVGLLRRRRLASAGHVLRLLPAGRDRARNHALQDAATLRSPGDCSFPRARCANTWRTSTTGSRSPAEWPLWREPFRNGSTAWPDHSRALPDRWPTATCSSGRRMIASAGETGHQPRPLLLALAKATASVAFANRGAGINRQLA